MIFIGMDDTDNHESRGTGHLARMAAAALGSDLPVAGVTRHQLLDDVRVPRTAKNSCAAILVDTDSADLDELFERMKAIMLADFQAGSDPGLCVCNKVPDAVVTFGLQAKEVLVDQSMAREIAHVHAIRLEGLGGDEGGVIGALAAVGLAATGEDGRYVTVGTVRELSGWVPVPALIAAGVRRVETRGGDVVASGMVLADKLRPSRRGAEPVAVVVRHPDGWCPLKLD